MLRSGTRVSLVFLLGATLIGLSGCTTTSPTPADVMAKTNIALGKLGSFNYRLDLKLAGNLPSNFSSRIDAAHLQAVGAAIGKPAEAPKFTLDGQLSADASEGGVLLSGNLISLPDYTYFRITDLRLPTLLTSQLGADSRWYKIKHVNETDAKKLGVASVGQTLTTAQLGEARQTLEKSDLFNVVEALPDTTLLGTRVYHYLVQLNPDALPQVADQLASLIGQPKFSDDQITSLAKYQAEIWVDKHDYNLVQIHIKDVYTTNHLPTSFDLTLNLDQQNKPAKINAPTTPEELNPNNLWPLSK